MEVGANRAPRPNFSLKCLVLPHLCQSSPQWETCFWSWLMTQASFALQLFSFSCRHASGRAGNIPHDPPREAGHDVQCYLEQSHPPCVPQVHARRKYPLPSLPPLPAHCLLPFRARFLQTPWSFKRQEGGTCPSGSDDSLKTHRGRAS